MPNSEAGVERTSSVMGRWAAAIQEDVVTLSFQFIFFVPLSFSICPFSVFFVLLLLLYVLYFKSEPTGLLQDKKKRQKEDRKKYRHFS